MHTVDLMDQALAAARRLGYRVRHVWMGGLGSGGCVIKGQKWIFVDLALNPVEQLDRVAQALAVEPGFSSIPIAAELRRFMQR